MIDPLELQRRLFSEKSLFGVLNTFESAFLKPITAKWLSAFTVMVLAISFWGMATLSDDPIDAREFLAALVAFGGQLSGSLLGVAIAGFSIFAASMKPQIIERLILTDYKDGGPNTLSFIFASFVYILVALFVLLFTSFLLIFFALPKSVFYSQTILPLGNDFMEFGFLALTSLYCGQLIFVFSVLASFIWNLHQILMVIAATEVVKENSEK